MARTLAFIASSPQRLALHDRLRILVVSGCALALIMADKALPAL